MKAISVVPGDPDSVEVRDVAEPRPGADELLVRGRLLGICGTDADIVSGPGYGWAPPGSDRLVIGHESLGTVLHAPDGSGFAPGDLVAGAVRRPDPEPCVPCAHGEWDFCSNGRYTERGIKELDGYGAQCWTVETDFAVRLDPALGDCGVLLEPTSVVAKAWAQADRFTGRTSARPRTALVTGAGPIGLLAALLGVQRGLDVTVLDVNDRGPKAELVTDLGARFHVGSVADLGLCPDVVIECTGHGPLVAELAAASAPNAVICLAGISSRPGSATVDLDEVNKEIVLRNTLLFGSVSASPGDFRRAADALARADRDWLSRLITRRVPMEEFARNVRKDPDDVKVVVDLEA
ncbi:glucose 1-dehydrogenase [Actinomadura atramentaria]|uniref:glucose 1-dehydrogenase n=1 Tax=Actinomadura atramentaria TaxID=1990 RepID=UPI00037DCA26|nr:glucose 1-dehydrogenase [Actinomadura atramentaria]